MQIEALPGAKRGPGAFHDVGFRLYEADPRQAHPIREETAEASSITRASGPTRSDTTPRASSCDWRRLAPVLDRAEKVVRPCLIGGADSPAGLAAWIVEKFRAWSDCGGEVESAFSRDALLDNISLYWFTGTIASSMRLYREAAREPLVLTDGRRIAQPLGFARFPREISLPPREWLERFFADLRSYREMPRGGHFAAMEQPGALMEDISRFFRPLRPLLG